ncbi:MAG: type II toxin-antitoxin system HigA family antitoxin [Planctomycetota bacterium]
MSTVKELKAVSQAWSNPDVRTIFSPIDSAKKYRLIERFVEDLLAIVGDDEDHELNGVLETLSNNLHAYEEAHHRIPRAPAREVLRFLMDQHELKQVDLAEDFGGQGNVSDVLRGKRDLSKAQIQALSKRFNVSPAVFFD